MELILAMFMDPANQETDVYMYIYITNVKETNSMKLDHLIIHF